MKVARIEGGGVFICRHQQSGGAKSVAKQPVRSMGSPEAILPKHPDVKWYWSHSC